MFWSSVPWKPCRYSLYHNPKERTIIKFAHCSFASQKRRKKKTFQIINDCLSSMIVLCIMQHYNLTTAVLTLKISSRFGLRTWHSLSIAIATFCRSSKFRKVLLLASEGTCCKGTTRGTFSKHPVATASSTIAANLVYSMKSGLQKETW